MFGEFRSGGKTGAHRHVVLAMTEAKELSVTPTPHLYDRERRLSAARTGELAARIAESRHQERRSALVRLWEKRRFAGPVAKPV